MADEKETIDAEVVNEETKEENKETNNSGFDKSSLEDLIKTVDNLPLWAKVILALPAVDIVWVLYRLLKSILKNNTTGIVIAVILLVIGFPFLWLIDILCIAFNGKVWWID